MSVREIERTVFSQGSVVLFRWRNVEGWPVETVTENVAEIFGYGAEDFTNGSVPYADVVHPDDLPAVTAEVEEHIRRGSGRFQHQDYRIVRPDGGIRWVQDFTVLPRDDSGAVTAPVGYVVDITDRKLVEEQLRNSHEDMERRVAERTAELTREILERELMETALRRRDAIQRTINETTMTLFSATDWTRIVGEVLKSIGEVARADRVHILQHAVDSDGVPFIGVTHEWTAPGVTPQIDNPRLRRIDMANGNYGRWTEALKAGEPVQALAREMPDPDREIAEATEASAVLMVSIFVDDEWWGVISFVAARTERTWNDIEKQSLGMVAGALGAAIRRSRDEAALRQSEQRLRGAIDSLQEGFAYFDAEDRLVVFNDAYREFNPMADRAAAEGWTYEDLLRANVERGVLVEARGKEDEFLRNRMAWHRDPGRPIIRTFGIGRVVLIKEARTPEGGTALTLFDITELQEANRALDEAKSEAEELKAQLQDAIESSSDAFALYGEDGCLVVANEAYKNLFRHTRDLMRPGAGFEDILRKRADLGLVPDLGDDPEAWLRKRMQHFFNPVGSMERLFPDGTWWQVSEQRTRRGGVAQIYTDITLLKAREDALRESEARFRNLFYHTAVGSMVVGLDGRYRAANEALCRMLGYTETELLGQSVVDITHPLDRDRSRNVIEKCRSGTQASWIEEKRYLRKDGETVWAIVSVAMIFDAEGEPAYTVGHVQDITERKRAEVATRMLQDELAHVSRVSTMGEMATGLAHELNQPLTAIVNYAQGTLRRHRSGAARTEDFIRVLELVGEQAHRAGDVIRGIRKFVRKDTSEIGPVDINAAIEEAVGLLRTESMRHDVEITLDLAAGLPPILGNAVQLQQVILNLARNSLEAMEDDNSDERRLTIGTSGDGEGHLRIVVEDTGSGVAETVRSRLFDPFFTTKAEGMGMGLSICKSIIAAHGGDISVASSASGGACFQVDLETDARETGGMTEV